MTFKHNWPLVILIEYNLSSVSWTAGPMNNKQQVVMCLQKSRNPGQPIPKNFKIQ